MEQIVLITVWALLIAVLLVIVLPVVAYLVVKLSTLGFYRGKQVFEKKFRKEQNHDGKRPI